VFYKKLIEYLEKETTDKCVAQRILSELPKDINNEYLTEKREFSDKRAKENKNSKNLKECKSKNSYFDKLVDQKNNNGTK